jgi:hypothetical protein
MGLNAGDSTPACSISEGDIQYLTGCRWQQAQSGFEDYMTKRAIGKLQHGIDLLR